MTETQTGEAAAVPRIALVDQARSLALLGMAVFHFCFDLELFGWLPQGTATSSPLRPLAITVAASFLALAGVSLVLAHGLQRSQGIRWQGFLRRLAVLVLAAAGVSVATYFVFPQSFVYFGILHAIATFSVLGLLLLPLPWAALLALAAAVFWAPDLLRSEVFAAPIWHWTGLAPAPRPSVDFIPLFPWLSALLLGMAGAKLADRLGLWTHFSTTPGPLGRALAWPGQHSLAIYLIHQPVFFALLWLVSLIL